MSRCILIVDDKMSLRQLVRSYLEGEGYRVVEAVDGREGLFVARHERPDLIILDLMMPNMDGYDFIRLHAKEADTPIIVLTARVEEDDRVLGLEIGADDYVTKPFSMRELSARVKAVLRRTRKGTTESDMLRAADVTVDRLGHLVFVGDDRIDLTPSEFDLLVSLMSAPGRAFSRFELMERMQGGGGIEGIERTIDVHIRNLRAKIEPDPGNPRYVETVYGIGYRFTPDATGID